MTHDAETVERVAYAISTALYENINSSEPLADIAARAALSALPTQEVSVKDAAKVLLDDPVAFRTMATAARRSQASCDETPKYPPLFELLDFSGENKTLIVVNAAIDAALRAISEGE